MALILPADPNQVVITLTPQQRAIFERRAKLAKQDLVTYLLGRIAYLASR